MSARRPRGRPPQQTPPPQGLALLPHHDRPPVPGQLSVAGSLSSTSDISPTSLSPPTNPASHLLPCPRVWSQESVPPTSWPFLLFANMDLGSIPTPSELLLRRRYVRGDDGDPGTETRHQRGRGGGEGGGGRCAMATRLLPRGSLETTMRPASGAAKAFIGGGPPPLRRPASCQGGGMAREGVVGRTGSSQRQRGTAHGSIGTPEG